MLGEELTGPKFVHLNTLSYTCLKHFPKFASSLHFEFSLSHNFLDGQCDVVDQVLTASLLVIVTCAGDSSEQTWGPPLPQAA